MKSMLTPLAAQGQLTLGDQLLRVQADKKPAGGKKEAHNCRWRINCIETRQIPMNCHGIAIEKRE